jgi:hypothetical protein
MMHQIYMTFHNQQFFGSSLGYSFRAAYEGAVKSTPDEMLTLLARLDVIEPPSQVDQLLDLHAA